MTSIRYEHYSSAWAFESFVKDLVLESRSSKICEVGAGANPALDAEFVRARSLSYSLIDISEVELAKAGAVHDRIVADIADRHFVPPDRYDFVFSKMLAEHVRDAEAFHRNVYSLLTRNGLAVHFFPTLYALPFLANRLLPETWSEWIVQRAWPSRRSAGKHAKFPALYQWCYGPTRKQLQRFAGLGYDVQEYIGFFGHAYFDRIAPLRALSSWTTRQLVEHPNPYLTSYAYVVLRRRD
jgi:2-polyprenyl-3-methyl-5-hydroxy-6-metoxy-1,4-benzoquinol methylase